MSRKPKRISWIVRDATNRYRMEYGNYRWNQWQACIKDIGCRFVWTSALPGSGMIVNDTIYINRGMTAEETARIAWHEIGHALLHVGSTQYWSERPAGSVIASKAERQADEFAEIFPIWDAEEGTPA